MPIIAKGSPNPGEFKPAPAGGHAAICVDIVDLGLTPNKFNPGKMKHDIKINFLIDEMMSNGQPFMVGRYFTLSLHEKATLTKFIESWRGKAFTPEETVNGFDVEKLIGAPALLQITHAERNGRVYAEIQAIMGLPKQYPVPVIPDSFVRNKDRLKTQPQEEAEEGPSLTDDNLDEHNENQDGRDKIPF